jgi:hypothetical protein
VYYFSREWPAYTGQGSIYNDQISFSVVAPSGTIASGATTVNALHALFEPGPYPGGNYVTEDRIVDFTNLAASGDSWIDARGTAENVGDGSLGSGVAFEFICGIDLDVDSNNDGTIDEADDPIEEQTPGKWGWINNDDSDGDQAPDNANNVIDGTSDLEDIGELQVQPIPEVLAAEPHLYLEIDDPSLVRVFADRSAGASGILGPGLGSSVEITGSAMNGHTFGMEGLAAGTVTVSLILWDGIVEVCRDDLLVTVIALRPRLLTFTGNADDFHQIQQDNGSGVYTAPHWQDNSSPLDSDAADAGDRRFPVAYTRNTTMRIAEARFVVQPADLLGGAVSVSGVGPGGIDFAADGAIAGDEVTLTDVAAAQPLPDAVSYFDPFEIAWSFSVDGGTTWFGGARTDHRVYATLAEPVSEPVFETVLYLACSEPGATNPDAAVANTWSLFAGPGNIATWDGEALTYYATVDGGSCTATSCLLVSHEGQCHSFASLLKDAMEANGIVDVRITRVLPPIDHDAFGVKNLGFDPTPSFPAEPIYKYSIGDLIVTVSGIPGQNTNPPSAKLFSQHFIVHRGSGSEYYDPSYGTATTGAADYSGNFDAWRRASDVRWCKSDGLGLVVRFSDIP